MSMVTFISDLFNNLKKNQKFPHQKKSKTSVLLYKNCSFMNLTTISWISSVQNSLPPWSAPSRRYNFTSLLHCFSLLYTSTLTRGLIVLSSFHETLIPAVILYLRQHCTPQTIFCTMGILTAPSTYLSKDGYSSYVHSLISMLMPSFLTCTNTA